MLKEITKHLTKQLLTNSIEPVNFGDTYTENGITHVYILDDNKEYKLVNGEWLLQPPF